MSTRSAEDTIKGYFYQFDYSTLKILDAPKTTDTITIEGIEDVDIGSGDKTKAIQCKYYAKTEYNHSVIGKPIRLMLEHFSKVLLGKEPKIKYHIYGHYKSGQSKLTLPLSVENLKSQFLSYTKNKIKKNRHLELGLNDTDLKKFLKLLTIDINALEYGMQIKDIHEKLKKQFKCSDFEAEYYYYNNALNEIKNLAIQSTLTKRKITKGEFLKRIDNKKNLFNKWFIALKGLATYHKNLRSEHFSTYNKSDYERFFVVDLWENPKTQSLKEISYHISRKFSNIKRRESRPFCPYLLFLNLKPVDLANLKNQLWNEGFTFIDGYPHLGAKFSIKHILKKATHDNKIQLKFIEEESQLQHLIKEISKTKEVYYFFSSKSKLKIDNPVSKLRQIEITELEHLKAII